MKKLILSLFMITMFVCHPCLGVVTSTPSASEEETKDENISEETSGNIDTSWEKKLSALKKKNAELLGRADLDPKRDYVPAIRKNYGDVFGQSYLKNLGKNHPDVPDIRGITPRMLSEGRRNLRHVALSPERESAKRAMQKHTENREQQEDFLKKARARLKHVQ